MEIATPASTPKPGVHSPGNTASWQAHQAMDSLDGGQVDARNQQNRRAGDAGQYHGRDGHRAGGKQVGVLQRLQLEVVDAAQAPGVGAQQGQPHHDATSIIRFERLSRSWIIITVPTFLGQYRIILSADTESEVRQLLSQKRR